MGRKRISPEDQQTITVRMPISLHAALKERAEAAGLSLNQFAIKALSVPIQTTLLVKALKAEPHRVADEDSVRMYEPPTDEENADIDPMYDDDIEKTYNSEETETLDKGWDTEL
jgi:hypothetical protein